MLTEQYKILVLGLLGTAHKKNMNFTQERCASTYGVYDRSARKPRAPATQS